MTCNVAEKMAIELSLMVIQKGCFIANLEGAKISFVDLRKRTRIEEGFNK